MNFVKRDPAPLEAAGLRWLAEAGARVPSIVEEQPGVLVLQRIRPGTLDGAGEEDLGRMLATVHAAGAPRFGSLPAPGRFFVTVARMAMSCRPKPSSSRKASPVQLPSFQDAMMRRA